MITEEITIKHKTIIQNQINTLEKCLSEYSFSNIFCFKESHEYKLCYIDDNMLIKGTDNGKTFAIPLINYKKENENFLNKIFNEVDYIYPLCEKAIKYFDKSKYNVIYNEDNSDYIYATEKLSFLPGRKLSKKRNLISQFKRAYDPKTELIDPKNIKDIEPILKQWEEQKNGIESTDINACKAAVEYFFDLNNNGFILYDEETPIGFIICEKITDDTIDVKFAKANINYKGAYQYLFNQAAKIYNHSKWFNFEQDLGIEELRKMKRSYLPDRLMHKYCVSKK